MTNSHQNKLFETNTINFFVIYYNLFLMGLFRHENEHSSWWFVWNFISDKINDFLKIYLWGQQIKFNFESGEPKWNKQQVQHVYLNHCDGVLTNYQNPLLRQ